MRKTLLIALMLTVAVPLYADKKSDAKAEMAFGVLVAQKGLWKEAVFRWEKATTLDPGNALAWNDLGIGYEEMGRMDDARKAYETALKIEPSNSIIHQNYDSFRDIYDRQKQHK